MLPINYEERLDRYRLAQAPHRNHRRPRSVFGVVALGTLLWPPLYSSNCQVLVQDNRAQLLVSPDLQGNTPSEFLGSQ